jgi:microcin C transport system permease protein
MPITPLWQRRLAAYRRNKPGLIASFVFTVILLLSLSAPLLANSRPLLIAYRGHFYLPILQTLSGRTFGPEFLPTEADYADPATQAAIRADGWILFPPIPFSAESIVWNAPPAPAPPSAENWLGTDAASRDVLARILYGLRTSLVLSFTLAAAAAAIGITAGAIQGFYGGLTDLLFQRFLEIWSGLPQLFLIIILASIIRPSFASLLLFLLLFSWMPLTNRVRAEFFRVRAQDYVRAARALGVSDWRIMRRHMLPNAAIAVLTFAPFLLAESITLLASLDFLGFGLPAGAPSLGDIILEAKNNPQAPWLGLSIFITLAILLVCLVFIGEALRDAFSRSARS